MDTTPITPAEFLVAFPEFSNKTAFPDTQIQFWATIAAMMLNARAWGRQLQLGMMLFIAHNIALEALAQAGTANGGIPGINRGVVASEAAGSVSVSYDTANALVPDAGHWNLTIYGTRFMWLVNMFGAGPIQIGASCGFTLLDSLAGRLRGSNIGDQTYIDVGPGWRSC